MRTNCEGCAGCCVDWRELAPGRQDRERRGPRRPLDDVHNLVPLTRDDVRTLLDAGLADAMTPRLWHADDGPAVSVDGVDLAAIDGGPAFFVGLRKPPKPVAPFGQAPRWLPTCAFLDPSTLQCRIHGTAHYPEECAEYPGHNLALDVETECERVEAAFGGARLLDDEPPDGQSGLLLGPGAIGAKVFVHPEPTRLSGVVRRLVDGRATAVDRAEFVAVAAASSPGTTVLNVEAYDRALERALATESWIGEAIEEWERLAADRDPDPAVAATVEDRRGAPGTPGWE